MLQSNVLGGTKADVTTYSKDPNRVKQRRTAISRQRLQKDRLHQGKIPEEGADDYSESSSQ